MRKILFLFIPVLILSCNTINKTRSELGIDPSCVIFTFDDGPDEHTTPLVLDLLKKHDIKAFFCLLGVNANQYPALVKRIHEEGHAIINHGYYDKHSILMEDAEFTDNLIRGEEAISSALGFDMFPKLYRPHGGYYKSSHEKILIDRGYSIIFSNVRAYDAGKTYLEKHGVIKNIINGVKKNNGGIILLHDARGSFTNKEVDLKLSPHGLSNRLWITEAVEEIITDLLNRGFFLHHSDLLKAINIKN